MSNQKAEMKNISLCTIKGVDYVSCDWSEKPDMYVNLFSKNFKTAKEASYLSISYLSYQNWRPFVIKD